VSRLKSQSKRALGHDRLYKNECAHNVFIENHSGLCGVIGPLLEVYGKDALYRPFDLGLCGERASVLERTNSPVMSRT